MTASNTQLCDYISESSEYVGDKVSVGTNTTNTYQQHLIPRNVKKSIFFCSHKNVKEKCYNSLHSSTHSNIFSAIFALCFSEFTIQCHTVVCVPSKDTATVTDLAQHPWHNTHENASLPLCLIFFPRKSKLLLHV